MAATDGSLPVVDLSGRQVHPGFRPSCLLNALRHLVQHVEKAMSRTGRQLLPGAPMTAGQLLPGRCDVMSVASLRTS